MSSRNFPVLIVPGLGDSGPDHWQSRWQAVLDPYYRVSFSDWHAPDCRDWVAQIDSAVKDCPPGTILIAHSSACIAAVKWCHQMYDRRVIGAFLVAPSDPLGQSYPLGPRGFAPVPLLPLPVPSTIIASTNDIYMDPATALVWAEAWGSTVHFIDAAGHINAAAGFGDWPQGLQWLNELNENTSRQVE